MRWPWVSRKRYQRVLRKLRQSEVERKELLDRILKAPQLLDAIADALPDPASAEAREMADPTTGALTAKQMRAVFRKQKLEGKA